MYWDRFDIVEAYYLYYTHYHSGMWSHEYARRSNMDGYFTPSLGFCYDELTDNGKDIYNALVERTEV